MSKVVNGMGIALGLFSNSPSLYFLITGWFMSVSEIWYIVSKTQYYTIGIQNDASYYILKSVLESYQNSK